MKKLFFHSLAIALGLAGSQAFGQFPSGYNNFGPSAYPVQTQNGLQSLPQVPQGYAEQQQQYQTVAQQQFAPQQGYAAQSQVSNVPAQQGPYQLVGAQEQVHSGHNHAGAVGAAQAPYYNAPAAPAMQAPPMVGDAGCQTCTQPAPAFNAQPQVDYGYGHSVAPNSMACGSAPVSQGFVNGPVYSSGGYGAGGILGNGPRPQLLGGNAFSGMPSQARSWFGGAGALLFNRVDDTAKSLSIDDTSYSDVLSTRDARFGVAGGFEGTIGRYFNCGRNAIAGTYWGVFPQTQTVQRSGAAGQFRSRIPFTYLEMPPILTYPTGANSVYDWYDGAAAHMLQRSAEYHNVEVNLLGFAMGGAARNFNTGRQAMFGGRGNRGCGSCGGAGCGSCASSCGPAPRFGTGPCGLSAPSCGSRLNVSWLAGFRYFSFNDNLLFAASFNDTVIDRSADDLYYEVNTTNDLFGAQLGSRIDYCLGQRINAYGTVKAGVYNNRSTLYSRIGTDDFAAYLNDTRTPTNPNNGQNFVFNETKNDVAFLTELGTGLGMRLTGNWSANVGYRAVVASGVATSVDNIEYAHANYADIRDFNNRGILVLHGMNLGATYNY